MLPTVHRMRSPWGQAPRVPGRLWCWWQRQDSLSQPPSARAADATLEYAPNPLRRVEAVLMLNHEPISAKRLAQQADLADATQARTLARQLNDLLDRAASAMRVEEVAGGFVLLSRPDVARWLRRLDWLPTGQPLPLPALETLAIVAYRQPTTRAAIEAVRGAGCEEILKQLMERDLIRICGRGEELGRPYLYATTPAFLQKFGLASLADLPPLPRSA